MYMFFPYIALFNSLGLSCRVYDILGANAKFDAVPIATYDTLYVTQAMEGRLWKDLVQQKFRS